MQRALYGTERQNCSDQCRKSRTSDSGAVAMGGISSTPRNSRLTPSLYRSFVRVCVCAAIKSSAGAHRASDYLQLALGRRHRRRRRRRRFAGVRVKNARPQCARLFGAAPDVHATGRVDERTRHQRLHYGMEINQQYGIETSAAHRIHKPSTASADTHTHHHRNAHHSRCTVRVCAGRW